MRIVDDCCRVHHQLTVLHMLCFVCNDRSQSQGDNEMSALETL